MSDASVWSVPYRFVAEHRAEYYATQVAVVPSGKEAFDAELASQDDSDVVDWAKNNLNWSDVSHLAVKVLSPARTVDYADGWCNGPMVVVDA